ncbi:MAG: zinc ABC transporter substrate-binding protein ZnuA [Rouxiella badensis]|jgi:zinc transport system substrate-binding protein
MIKMKKSFLVRAVMAASLLTASVVTTAQAAVLASLRPLGFIAAAIADGVTPTDVLLPDGQSPHGYSLHPSDLQRMRSADLLVWVGPDMESFMSKSVAQLPPNRVVDLSAIPEVKPLLMAADNQEQREHDIRAHNKIADDQQTAVYDMSVWLSPDIAKLTAIAIHAKLLELMPQKKDQLDANLRQFEAGLTKTDIKLGKMLQPVQGKGYFVFQDTFSYFEKHYGLSPMGRLSVNPEIPPGVQRLHQIRTQLVEQKAVCVFAEPQFRPAIINAVAQGTTVRTSTLDPLGGGIALTKDSYVNFLSHLTSQYVSCLK